MDDLQKRVKWSIERTWTNCLSNDYLPTRKAKTFSLMKFYTELEWVGIVEGGLRDRTERKANMFELFKIREAGEKPLNILVKGKKSIYL